MANTKVSHLSKEVKIENSDNTLESGVPKKDIQDTKVSDNQELNRNDFASMIQSLADKLIQNNSAEWHKITLKDSRKGYALFFPDSKWKLENEMIVENI